MSTLTLRFGSLTRRALGRRVRGGSRNDHIHLFSSPENARRLREAIEDARAGRNMIPLTIEELRRELGLEKA